MIATVRPFELTLSSPLGTARGRIEAREGFLFDVFDDPAGLGEACPLHPFTEKRSRCHDVLQAAADAYTDSGWRPAFQAVSATEGGGLEFPAARHAVSLAHLDRRARSNHEPLYSHLADGNPDGTAPLSATVGDHPPDEAVDQAVSAVEAGYAAVTIKVGGRSIAAEAERIRAVRSAIGTEADLRLDANGAWSFGEARAFLESTSELDLDYLEQPLDPDELAGHARLRERGVDIGLDESVALHGIEAVREAGAADVFVLKPMTLGGIDVTRGTARDLLADEHRAVIATTIDSAVARTGAVHVAASLSDVSPSPLSIGDILENDVAEDPVTVVEGTLSVPDTPGLGIDDVEI